MSNLTVYLSKLTFTDDWCLPLVEILHPMQREIISLNKDFILCVVNALFSAHKVQGAFLKSLCTKMILREYL